MDKWLARIAPDCVDNIATIIPTTDGLARANKHYEKGSLSAALIDARNVSNVDPVHYTSIKQLVRTGGIFAVQGLKSDKAHQTLYGAIGNSTQAHGMRAICSDGHIKWTRVCRMQGASVMNRRTVGLEYYVQWLNDNEPCAFTRWCDTSWPCIVGADFKGMRYQKHTPELTEDLRRALCEYHDDPNYVMTTTSSKMKMRYVTVAPYWELAAAYIRDHHLDGIEWASAGPFITANRDGKLWPFIEAVRRHRTILVVSFRYAGLLYRVFPDADLVAIPGGGSYNYLEQIESAILSHEFPAVVLISAGLTSKVIIHNLYNKAPGFYFDMGSIWGPYVGWIEHIHQKAVTPDVMKANLGGQKHFDYLRQ